MVGVASHPVSHIEPTSTTPAAIRAGDGHGKPARDTQRRLAGRAKVK